MGVKFRADTTGYITGLRFYKGSADTGTHVGYLWNSSGGLLVTATFTTETASGWQTVNLPNPIFIGTNQTFIAAYYSSNGYYATSPGYFVTGVDNPPLYALPAGIEGPNGVFAYNGGLPTSGISNNYWVDVIFTPGTATPPVANADAYTIAEDAVLTVSAAQGVLSNDQGSGLLTAVKQSDPTHGSLTLNPDGSFTYTPVANYNGSDSFSYYVSNGTLFSSAVAVSLTVTPINDPPVATSQSVSTLANTTLPVTLTATDLDNDPLTYNIVLSPTSGSLSGTGANRTYAPNVGFSGTDTFTFVATDGLASPNVATVTITVNAPVPALTNMNPTTGTVGGANFTLTVTGTNFVNNSVVRWNGSSRSTTYVSSTQLQASIRHGSRSSRYGQCHGVQPSTRRRYIQRIVIRD